MFARGSGVFAGKVKDVLPFKMTYYRRYIPLQGSKQTEKVFNHQSFAGSLQLRNAIAFKASNFSG